MAGVFWSPLYKRELKACKNHRINFLAHCGTFTSIWTQMIKTQFWLTFPKWNSTICTCDLGKQRRKVGMINIFLTLHISSVLDIFIVQLKRMNKTFLWLYTLSKLPRMAVQVRICIFPELHIKNSTFRNIKLMNSPIQSTHGLN